MPASPSMAATMTSQIGHPIFSEIAMGSDSLVKVTVYCPLCCELLRRTSVTYSLRSGWRSHGRSCWWCRAAAIARRTYSACLCPPTSLTAPMLALQRRLGMLDEFGLRLRTAATTVKVSSPGGWKPIFPAR